MRTVLILIAAIASFTTFPVASQEVAPIPRPRPERVEPLALQSQTSPDEAVKLPDISPEMAVDTSQPALSGPPQPITLSAKVSEDGIVLPNGVMWRVFETRTDETGELALLAKSENPVAVFTLKPGDYVVHVAYGRSQASDTIRVESAPSSKTIVLDSGGLRLNASIEGDIPIQPALLNFNIYGSDGVQQEGPLIAGNVSPGEIIHLNAGVYHIVSNYGATNAEVRTNLRVDPGQLTDATLYHHASPVNFRLVSEIGGEAIADVDWTIKTPEGEVLLTYFGAFPSTILAEGVYVVLAKRGANVYNRDFEVKAGAGAEIEVLTSVY